MTELELQKEAESVWRHAVDAFLKSHDKRGCATAVIAAALRKMSVQKISPVYHGTCPNCGKTLELRL